MTSKSTPFHSWHTDKDARMVDFAGWSMPVQFSGVVAEHKAVRSGAGIFDISHMGQALVTGPDAYPSLQQLFTNDLDLLDDGKGQYTVMCNENGGVIDDLYVFRLASQAYFLVYNASREDIDIDWITRNLKGATAFEPIIRDRAAFALQGPTSAELMETVIPGSAALRKNRIFEHDGVWVSRTGYTGEDGFEVFGSTMAVRPIWDQLFESAGDNLIPVGLGARDTLRIEAGYPLYGHEMDIQVSPVEAGYGWVVKEGKHFDFPGRTFLADQKAGNIYRKTIGLIIQERGVPREGFEVWSGGHLFGKVTSGTFSPSLQKGICIARVGVEAAGPFEVKINGRLAVADEVSLPFYTL